MASPDIAASNGERGNRTLLDIKAVAQRLGVSVRHVRRLVAERRIPYLKIGHFLRFDSEEIEEWIDQNRRPPIAHRVPAVP